ncbi:MAG: response regulator [Deltaproteobacteria bacterium]|nr:response regulator [Deltaproteobacteria bacterium]
MRQEQHKTCNLLIVDDRPDNLLVLEHVIKEYLPECGVVAVRSAEQGIETLRATAVEAALIDLQMQDIDGIEMCRRLKDNPATAQIPVALITSHSVDHTTRAKGLEAGADDFISRPINNLELVARIRVLLRVKRSEDELRRVNARLEELVAERTKDLKATIERLESLSRKVLMAQEEERARVSRELHDELGQLLAAARYELGFLSNTQARSAHAHDLDFANAIGMIERAANELRRICQGLRPPLLDTLGLEPSIEMLVREFRERTGMNIESDIRIDEIEARISPDIALCTYRILQEALNNIVRHASAAKVTVSVFAEASDLKLTVQDDGKGFDLPKVDATKGCGILGMRERAWLVNGTVSIWSALLRGTRVTFSVPLRSSYERIQRPERS